MTKIRPYLETLRIQRWDDHRYYHQSRINQTLHLISALSFLVAYALLFFDPPTAALVAWGISMTTRQAGHFFFEPHDYDKINRATHEYKEQIKVGYNLRRKVVLMSLWALAPILLLLSPSLLGAFSPASDLSEYLNHLGMIWLLVGVGGVAFRMVQLFLLQNVATGIVWVCKIITDPFHDIAMYWRSPLALLRGELLDPMLHVEKHP